jgi:GH35 family endo-1,4-beta-xylanase
MIQKITRYASTIITIAIVCILISANGLYNSNKIKVDALSDQYSLLNDWPIKGRANYPLLFDREYQPKLAYKTLVNLMEN